MWLTLNAVYDTAAPLDSEGHGPTVSPSCPLSFSDLTLAWHSTSSTYHPHAETDTSFDYLDHNRISGLIEDTLRSKKCGPYLSLEVKVAYLRTRPTYNPSLLCTCSRPRQQRRSATKEDTYNILFA